MSSALGEDGADPMDGGDEAVRCLSGLDGVDEVGDDVAPDLLVHPVRDAGVGQDFGVVLRGRDVDQDPGALASPGQAAPDELARRGLVRLRPLDEARHQPVSPFRQRKHDAEHESDHELDLEDARRAERGDPDQRPRRDERREQRPEHRHGAVAAGLRRHDHDDLARRMGLRVPDRTRQALAVVGRDHRGPTSFPRRRRLRRIRPRPSIRRRPRTSRLRRPSRRLLRTSRRPRNPRPRDRGPRDLRRE
jgi:hypothetical protein